MADTHPTPLITVVVPTFNRVPQLLNLLNGLSRQTLAVGQFEVIVSDDGSSDPVAEAVHRRDWPFAFTFLQQENAGPAAARNRAIEQARGPLTLILNDDAVVAEDLLHVHLLAHTRRNIPLAVLGSFGFVDAALKRPFVRLMEESNLLFDFASMQAGRVYDWRYFWTCNISLPTRALVAVGGFDEDFTEPICEDVEIGYRLGQIDIPVLYLPAARCRHDHDIDPTRYARRQVALGRNTILMCDKHPEPELLRAWGLPALNGRNVVAAGKAAMAQAPAADEALVRLQELDAAGLPAAPERQKMLLDEMETLAHRISSQRCLRGLVEEWVRRHGSAECDAGAPPLSYSVNDPGCIVHGDGALTSIIIPCIDGWEHTRRCLDSIAAHTPEPHEVIVVDNGSGPVALDRLRARADITLLEMGENVGAPAARNRGLELAVGDPIIFLDNDTQLTPGWLELLAGHTRNNPSVGMVGPMSNTVSGSQKVEDSTYRPERVDEYSAALTAANPGRHHYTNRLILFALLVRRRVIDVIGGFDEAFGRWGFEDDDFCMRAGIAGFRLRVAEDVFIHHTGSQTSVAAGLDYDRLLRANWVVFKKKWDIDDELPYGSPYPLDGILFRTFDAKRHKVPLTSGPPARLAPPASRPTSI